jgi:hypothetical protein
MFFVMKAALLAIYALAAMGWAGFAGLLPAGLSGRMGSIALVILAVHALELLFAFRHVKRYKGPLAVSVLLTILFGMLHWKPLADKNRPPGKTVSAQEPSEPSKPW